MINTNQLLNSIVNQVQPASKEVTVPTYIDAEASQGDADGVLMERIVNDLFLFLKNSYSSFKNGLKTSAEVAHAKREWSRTLIENGIVTQEAIFIGKQAVRKLGGEWAPGPSDFCKMCIPPELNIPSPTQAFYEAANGSTHPSKVSWSHGIVYQAGKKAGWHMLRGEVAGISQPAFTEIYKDMTRRMHMGEVFLPPIQAAKTTKNRLTVDAKAVHLSLIHI